MERKDRILLVIWSIILCVMFSPVEQERKQFGATATWEESEIIEVPETLQAKAYSNDIICLATNVYMESRGEPIKGQIAVAQVTLNRAKHNQDKLCKVVLAKSQFSWTLDKKITIDDDKSFKTAMWVAQNVLEGNLFDYAQGADHYHADYVSPKWADEDRQVTKIGKHIFYKLKGKKL